MIMLKCDRCGKVSQIKTPNFFSFPISKESGDFEQFPRYLVMKDYAQINLCSECEKDLDEFLDGREVKENFVATTPAEALKELSQRLTKEKYSKIIEEVGNVEEVKNVERNCKNCFYFNPPKRCFAQKNAPSVDGFEAETCDYFITKEEFWSDKWELKNE